MTATCVFSKQKVFLLWGKQIAATKRERGRARERGREREREREKESVCVCSRSEENMIMGHKMIV